MAILGNQLRAARALAGLGQEQLAESSGVSVNTIRNMEGRAADRVRVRLDTMEQIADALRDAGVEFIGEEDGRSGVRLIEPNAAHAARRTGKKARKP